MSRQHRYAQTAGNEPIIEDSFEEGILKAVHESFPSVAREPVEPCSEEATDKLVNQAHVIRKQMTSMQDEVESLRADRERAAEKILFLRGQLSDLTTKNLYLLEQYDESLCEIDRLKSLLENGGSAAPQKSSQPRDRLANLLADDKDCPNGSTSSTPARDRRTSDARSVRLPYSNDARNERVDRGFSRSSARDTSKSIS